MKVRIEAECTPEEARAFLGLPDMGPFNARVVEEMTRRMETNTAALQPDEVMKNWMSLGGAATEQFRGIIQTVLRSAATPRGGDDKAE